MALTKKKKKKIGSTNAAATNTLASTNHNFGCLNPYHFVVGLTKNEGLPDKNITLTQPNRCLIVLTPTKSWKRLQNECMTSLVKSRM